MKNFPKLLFVDSYVGVCYFDLDLVLRRIKGLNNNAAISWREFHAVLDQVPKDLLQPRRIAIDVALFGPETKFDVQLFRQNALAANFVGALQNFLHANHLQAQLKLALRDTSDVEQVIDQSGLQLHVAPDDFQRLTHFRSLRGAGFELGDHRENRRKRIAQLVRKQSQELVLRSVRRNQLLPLLNIARFIFD